ncbi:hypothetical protein [Nocardiopsis sp. LOL_012]|uniref:hypothetical protein n=1 Tax=Nocardiopsis sp. LOL_012 TaxID=3345409 RepID=UPI003A8ACAB6
MDPILPPHAVALDTAARQYGVLSWDQAKHIGLTKSDVRRFVRNGNWRRVYPRVYAVLALVDATDPGLRLRAKAMAAQLALGEASFVGGRTAVRLWGIQGLPEGDLNEMHMVIPARGTQRHIAGITLHTWKTRPEQVTTIDGVLRSATPQRALADTLLDVDRETAVCLMDSALNKGLIGAEEIEEVERVNWRRRGSVRLRGWWRSADGRAESPLETRVRLVCVDGGLPPTDLQHRFFDGRGRCIARVDFWWEDLDLIGEADGIGPHGSPRVLARDRTRQNALQLWHPSTRIVRFTWGDLNRPEYILATVARHRA